MAVGSGVTANRGYHFLLSGERPDIAGITAQLAGDLDTDVTALAQVYAKVITRSSGGTSFPNNQATAVGGWDTTPYDKGGITYANGVLTTPVGGLFLWSMTLTAPGGQAYSINLRVLVNGTANQSGQVQYNVPATSNTQSVSAGGPLVLAANDQVTLQATQNSGGALTLSQISASLIRVGS